MDSTPRPVGAENPDGRSQPNKGLEEAAEDSSFDEIKTQMLKAWADRKCIQKLSDFIKENFPKGAVLP